MNPVQVGRSWGALGDMGWEALEVGRLGAQGDRRGWGALGIRRLVAQEDNGLGAQGGRG